MNAMSAGWEDYARLMLTLCGILALAVVAIRFWLPRMTGWNKQTGGPIEVCARLALEPRRTLYIVKAAGSYMLLASSEAGVQQLAELNAETCASLIQTPPAGKS